jgi:hypothetical protein
VFVHRSRRASDYLAKGAVNRLEPEDVAVVDAVDPFDLAMAQHRAERAAVRDDEDGAVRMLARDALEGAEDAPVHLLARLAVAERALRKLIREELLDLRVAETFPGTEVPFAQGRERRHWEAVSVRDDSRGLIGAREIACVDRFERFAGQLFREGPRLLAARVVQRSVRVALQPAAEIPVGLTVAHEEDLRHAG